MTGELSSAQRQTMLQLLKIANISRDLDRSRDDGLHAGRGGRIVYVMDENVFEMFVQPFEHGRAIETFYAEEWKSQRLTSGVRRRYEAQSALIASEHLVNGNLPGNPDRILYMTEPHRWELFSRLTDLSASARRLVAQEPEPIRKAFRTKMAVLRDLKSQRIESGSDALDASNPTLRADLAADSKALADRGAGTSVIDRVAATRLAAEVLSVDELAEPLDQMRRLVSPDCRGRIRDLRQHVDFTTADRRAIDADALNWLDELERELELPENRHRKRAQNRDEMLGPLRNDAFSIAYLRWASKVCYKRGERLVFVTNDDLLFDAYRRWYANDDRDVSAEPFFMRRAAQYTPIFIPNDSGGDLSRGPDEGPGRHTIFDRVQEAIESTLLPLTVADDEDDDVDGVFSRSRERLALKLNQFRHSATDDELAAFIDGLSSDWLEGQRGALTETQRLWQLTQRVTIGASYDVLTSRLTPEQRALADKLGDATADEASIVLGEYAQGVLSELFQESVQLWLPLAKDFIWGRRRDFEGVAPNYQRIAIAMDLRGQFPELDFDTEPQLVFAEAAVRALRIQDANNAYRFSQLALRADEAAIGDVSSSPALTAELLYLAAVASRLLVCTIDLSARRDREDADDATALRRGINQIKDLYAEASTYLNRLAAYHDSAEERLEKDVAGQRIRYLRALSERASLNLFVATAFGLSRTGKKGIGPETDDSERYLEIARGDLRLCAFGDRDLPTTKLLQDVRDQYVPNITGYEVLAYVIDSGESYHPEQWPKVALSRLRQFVKENQHHALLRAELLAFSMIRGEVNPVSRQPDAKEFYDGFDTLRLALDKTLYRRIFADIFEVKAARRARDSQ